MANALRLTGGEEALETARFVENKANEISSMLAKDEFL